MFGLQPTCKTHLTHAGGQKIGSLCRSEQNRLWPSSEIIASREQKDVQRHELWCWKMLSFPRYLFRDSKPWEKICLCEDNLIFYIFFFLLLKLSAVLHIKHGASLILGHLHWQSWPPASLSLESLDGWDMLTEDNHHGSESPSQLRLNTWGNPQRLCLCS